ncbi:MAG TPA: monofunctional biosynthetic peptidoglycan transglycosylase [Thermoanaerobaculia bacterium]|nr:monofunctional biosynthetic peptidoglycan transglycosylase [Thermoanaerobaculia bacterium]
MRRLSLPLLCFLILVSLLLGWGLWEAITWPNVARLAKEDPKSTAFIERYQGTQGKDGKKRRADWRPVPASRISNELKHAVVVAEDIDFFSHHGFAWEEIKKAWKEAKEQDRPLRGASTLTQQLAKNLWLSPSRNPWRKAKEALLTRDLERHLSKTRILELYLNVVEFGPGIFGAEAASRRYFGKPAAFLSRAEAVQLAASLPKPSQWHPGSRSRVYQRRVARLLLRVEKTDWVRGQL